MRAGRPRSLAGRLIPLSARSFAPFARASRCGHASLLRPPLRRPLRSGRRRTRSAARRRGHSPGCSGEGARDLRRLEHAPLRIDRGTASGPRLRGRRAACRPAAAARHPARPARGRAPRLDRPALPFQGERGVRVQVGRALEHHRGPCRRRPPDARRRRRCRRSRNTISSPLRRADSHAAGTTRTPSVPSGEPRSTSSGRIRSGGATTRPQSSSCGRRRRIWFSGAIAIAPCESFGPARSISTQAGPAGLALRVAQMGDHARPRVRIVVRAVDPGAVHATGEQLCDEFGSSAASVGRVTRNPDAPADRRWPEQSVRLDAQPLVAQRERQPQRTRLVGSRTPRQRVQRIQNRIDGGEDVGLASSQGGEAQGSELRLDVAPVAAPQRQIVDDDYGRSRGGAGRPARSAPRAGPPARRDRDGGESARRGASQRGLGLPTSREPSDCDEAGERSPAMWRKHGERASRSGAEATGHDLTT